MRWDNSIKAWLFSKSRNEWITETVYDPELGVLGTINVYIRKDFKCLTAVTGKKGLTPVITVASVVTTPQHKGVFYNWFNKLYLNTNKPIVVESIINSDFIPLLNRMGAKWLDESNAVFLRR